MKAGRIVVLVLGCLLLIPGAALLFGGGALGIGYAVARDSDGYVDVRLDRLQTDTAAIRSEEVDFFAEPGSPDWVLDFIDADIRIDADAVDPGADLFVGIGAERDVVAYLAGTTHDQLVELDGRAPRYERNTGTLMLDPPAEQDFWVASSEGAAPVLEWEATDGTWVAVLMNADASRGVAADVVIGGKSGAVYPIAFAMMGVGALLIALAVTLIVVATRRPSGPARPATTPSAVAGIGDHRATQEHPVSVSARLDTDLSRWKWLVKWLLAIPHLIVLAVLWVAFVVTTFAAGVAILFTGRYPHRLFEFNVGVLRWTWRVTYYASSGGLGTDRYPPFRLDRDPGYAADLDIAYPERLSRGLVLVKWWLLAIPHYLILAVLVGGAVGWTTDSGDWSFGAPGGLLGLLVLIAGVILLVTGRYPRSLFDLVVGFNRWVYRVIAYAALMTDRYPPFRLDQGGEEPSGLPPTSTPSGESARSTLPPPAAPTA